MLGIRAIAHRLSSTKHSLVPPLFFALCLLHGYRFSPHYLVTLSLSLATSFNRGYTYSPSSCCLTNLATAPPSYGFSFAYSRAYLVLHSYWSHCFRQEPRLRHLSLSSHPLASSISSCHCLSSLSSSSTSTS